MKIRVIIDTLFSCQPLHSFVVLGQLMIFPSPVRSHNGCYYQANLLSTVPLLNEVVHSGGTERDSFS